MLRFPRALWIALAIAVLATSPALSAPLTFDDQFQALRIAGQVPGPSQDPFNVYSFGPGKIEPNGLGWDGCVYPWWSDAGHAARFFRPLSSAILYAEHRAFGRSPVPFHLVSLLVFLGALVLVSKLFRRLLPEREAALATFAFAVAPCHLQVACWAAAIHLSVTAIFVLSALLLYLDAREQRAASLTKHAGALLLGAMALSCGESALGLFAFLFAYETFGRTEARSHRVKALVPWALLFLGYVVVYKLGGYGVAKSSAYLDPLAAPLAYARELPLRLLLLSAGALLGASIEVAAFFPPHVALYYAAAGAVALVAFVPLVLVAGRGLDESARRNVRWLLIGSVLAALPAAAGFPGDRVVFLPSLAAAAGAGVILGAGLPLGRIRELAWPLRPAFVLICLLTFPLAPLRLFATAAFAGPLAEAGLRAAREAELPSRPGVRVVGLALSDPFVGFYLASEIWFAGRPGPLPATVQLLSMAPYNHVVRRTGERTIELEVADGGALLTTQIERLNRAPDHMYRVGDAVPRGPWLIRVEAVKDGDPTRISVTFDTSVDDPSLALIVWRDGRLRPLGPLAIGSEVRVPKERAVMPF